MLSNRNENTHSAENFSKVTHKENWADKSWCFICLSSSLFQSFAACSNFLSWTYCFQSWSHFKPEFKLMKSLKIRWSKFERSSFIRKWKVDFYYEGPMSTYFPHVIWAKWQHTMLCWWNDTFLCLKVFFSQTHKVHICWLKLYTWKTTFFTCCE